MTALELYTEWRDLKDKAISYQRAGIDDIMTNQMFDESLKNHKRIAEIETEMFPRLHQEKASYSGAPVPEVDAHIAKFYGPNNRLNGWIKAKDDLTVRDGLVYGEIIFAKIPQ